MGLFPKPLFSWIVSFDLCGIGIYKMFPCYVNKIKKGNFISLMALAVEPWGTLRAAQQMSFTMLSYFGLTVCALYLLANNGIALSVIGSLIVQSRKSGICF